MSEIFHGVVHGKTIELTDDPGIADGQSVEVVVRPAKTAQRATQRATRHSIENTVALYRRFEVEFEDRASI